MALVVATVVAGVTFLTRRSDAQWTERLEVIGMPLAGGVAFWLLLSSPALRVTASQVSYGVAWPFRLHIRRSDLAYIFRGQARMRGWRPCYFLVTRDDTPRITMSAVIFTDEGMTELAKRLEVPIKGDFSAQVRARFD